MKIFFGGTLEAGLFGRSKIRIILIPFISFFLISIIFQCKRVSPVTEPVSINSQTYFYYNIKVRIKKKNRRTKLRALLKYNKYGDKIVFLGAFNQVLFEALITRGNTLLIIPRKKKFWRGNFSGFIKKLWNIEIEYPQLKELVTDRRIPKKKNAEYFPEIAIDRSNRKFTKITLIRKDVLVELRIPPKKIKRGVINFKRDLSGYKEVSLKKTEMGDGQ